MEDVLKALVKVAYLGVLSFGKSRPDTKSNVGATIRDAKDNMNEINAVKLDLNEFLGLTVTPNAKSDNFRQHGRSI